MFGLKWLWKSNKTNIDTSNFVSKEFFTTTLQDYVNRDLFNTTLSDYITTTSLNNTLSNYVSTNSLNTTLANYVQTSSLNTTLSNYVQTSSLNTTLSNYVQTSSLNTTLSNYITTNTAQTITSLKTFRAAPIGLKLQQASGRTDKQYITFNSSDNTTLFSLGSQLSETSFETNRGNLLIQTKEANKKVIFDTPLVEFNRAVPQFGTEIKAGYGAGLVKFLPEDNSTKTLQFFQDNNTSNRRFNLKVAEPTEATNPTTKNYVDNAINNIQNGSTIRYRDYQFPDNSTTPSTVGEIVQYSLQINDNGINMNNVIGITANYLNQQYAAEKATYYKVSYSAKTDHSLFISIFTDKFIYTGLSPDSVKNIDFRNFRIRLIYCDNMTSSRDNQIYQGEIVKLQEIKGGK